MSARATAYKLEVIRSLHCRNKYLRLISGQFVLDGDLQREQGILQVVREAAVSLGCLQFMHTLLKSGSGGPAQTEGLPHTFRVLPSGFEYFFA